MERQKHAEKNLQWHPAFYAGIQIELEDEAENLIFENEHQLGTKPFGIDVLIVKKESEKPIRKNIGKIFRKHNIIEYKSPTDYLSIDDFYKVYGYTCFYKADVKIADSIRIEEVTISLVSRTCPKKLIRHLQEIKNYRIEKSGQGIYYVVGDQIPIQVIVTEELSKAENLWLKSLTNQLGDTEDAEILVQEYEKHKENTLYQSMMDVIVQANQEKFEEVRDMCQALEELMKDKIAEKAEERAREIAEERAREIAEERAREIAEERAREIAEERAREIAEERAKEMIEERAKEIAWEASRVNYLHKELAKAGRTADIIKAAEDKEYQDKLLDEFGL